jgi:hypothetical protein
MATSTSLGSRLFALFLALAALVACTRRDDVHELESTKATPCINCHRAAFASARAPKHEGVFPETCGDCHTTSSWSPAKSSEFHDLPPVKAKPCVDCHRDKYNATSKPKHAGLFPETCADCHGTKAWTPIVGNLHESEAVKNMECVKCHQGNYDGTKNPAHPGVFPTTCAGCHSTTSWTPATGVGHDWFPLNNTHAKTPCATCHTKGYAKGVTPNTCVGCHQKNYDGATNPSHKSPQAFPTDCKRCHNDAGWKPFYHGGWPLTGVHAAAQCVGCHTGNPPKYLGTPRECVGCHLADYNRSPFPGHQTFSQICSDCHKTTGWKPAQGGAHPEAKFPITSGTHAGLLCTDCHNPARGSPIGGVNTDCTGCHLGVHGLTSMDAKHQGRSRGGMTYGSQRALNTPNFCLKCHPMGRL